jgi:hypothetical protein
LVAVAQVAPAAVAQLHIKELAAQILFLAPLLPQAAAVVAVMALL